MSDFYISPFTRAKYTPSPDYLNISMDFNAAPSGKARGTEVVIPDNASPEVRAAAERFNVLVSDFARRYGIEDYPVRGVRTRSENKRGVSHTIHAEPFFNSDLEMQRLIQQNPEEFADIYRTAFGDISNARLIAPHGVGEDRGAASEIFGDETSYGELIANSLLQGEMTPEARRMRYADGTRDPGTTAQVVDAVLTGDMTKSEAARFVSEDLLDAIEPKEESWLDRLADAAKYMDMAGVGQAQQLDTPSRLPTSINRGRQNVGSAALQRFGLASLV